MYALRSNGNSIVALRGADCGMTDYSEMVADDNRFIAKNFFATSNARQKTCLRPMLCE
jgi:hypothetical protein